MRQVKNVKTNIICDAIPKAAANKAFYDSVVKALLLSVKEKGWITHAQYCECLRRLKL